MECNGAFEIDFFFDMPIAKNGQQFVQVFFFFANAAGFKIARS